MKKLKVTTDFLKRFKPCGAGLAMFRKVFPCGVTIADDQDFNLDAVLVLGEHYFHTVQWLCDELTGAGNAPLIEQPYLWAEGFEDGDGVWRSHYDISFTAGMLADAVGIYLKGKKR